MLEYWEIYQEQELDHGLSNEEMKAAIEHLGNALYLVIDILDAMDSGVMDIYDLSIKCEKSWNELNMCRLYTEKIVFIEEVAIPTMGYMLDAKMMFDSLVAWKLGMTIHAALSIRGCLDLAQAAIRQCLDEMVSWLQPGDRVPRSMERSAQAPLEW